MTDIVATLRSANFEVTDEAFVELPFDTGAWDLAIHLMTDVSRDALDAMVGALTTALITKVRKERTPGRRVIIFGANGEPLRVVDSAETEIEERGSSD